MLGSPTSCRKCRTRSAPAGRHGETRKKGRIGHLAVAQLCCASPTANPGGPKREAIVAKRIPPGGIDVPTHGLRRPRCLGRERRSSGARGPSGRCHLLRELDGLSRAQDGGAGAGARHPRTQGERHPARCLRRTSRPPRRRRRPRQAYQQDVCERGGAGQGADGSGPDAELEPGSRRPCATSGRAPSAQGRPARHRPRQRLLLRRTPQGHLQLHRDQGVERASRIGQRGYPGRGAQLGCRRDTPRPDPSQLGRNGAGRSLGGWALPLSPRRGSRRGRDAGSRQQRRVLLRRSPLSDPRSP